MTKKKAVDAQRYPHLDPDYYQGDAPEVAPDDQADAAALEDASDELLRQHSLVHEPDDEDGNVDTWPEPEGAAPRTTRRRRKAAE